MSGRYKVAGDIEDLQGEVNRIFEVLSDRLDQLEGVRGTPLIYSKQVTQGDVVVDIGGGGLVLRDNADPPNYWRVTINKYGALTQTKLGREYE